MPEKTEYVALEAVPDGYQLRVWFVQDDRADVLAYVVQLEESRNYLSPTSRPRQVARSDHDVDGPHDVREEGPHIDVYGRSRQEKIDVLRFEAPRNPNRALEFADEYLREHAGYFIRRYQNG